MPGHWKLGTEVGPSDHVHAIGVALLLWGHLEDMLDSLLLLYLGLDIKIGRQVLAGRGNADKTTLLANLCKKLEPDSKVRDRIEIFIKHFAICLENRNILGHSTSYHSRPRGSIKLSRPNKKEPNSKNAWTLSLTEIRTAAEEMDRTQRIGVNIIEFLTLGRGKTIKRMDGYPVRATLHEIPPLPRKLTPSPAQAQEA